jgi:Protein of unknown function (DUF3618)
MTAEVNEVQAQIAETRAALAETTEALAAKADVKSRAQAKVMEEKVPLAVVAGVCAVVVALLVWSRHR